MSGVSPEQLQGVSQRVWPWTVRTKTRTFPKERLKKKLSTGNNIPDIIIIYRIYIIILLCCPHNLFILVVQNLEKKSKLFLCPALWWTVTTTLFTGTYHTWTYYLVVICRCTLLGRSGAWPLCPDDLPWTREPSTPKHGSIHERQSTRSRELEWKARNRVHRAETLLLSGPALFSLSDLLSHFPPPISIDYPVRIPLGFFSKFRPPKGKSWEENTRITHCLQYSLERRAFLHSCGKDWSINFLTRWGVG